MSTDPVGYLSYIEKYRSDITLMHLSGTVLKTRLFSYEKKTALERNKITHKFVVNSIYPIYFSQPVLSGIGYIDYWVVFEYSAKIHLQIHRYVMHKKIDKILTFICARSRNRITLKIKHTSI